MIVEVILFLKYVSLFLQKKNKSPILMCSGWYFKFLADFKMETNVFFYKKAFYIKNKHSVY
jgi:hypothetical protein